MATRLSRVEQVERNRARVLDAAREVFLARGYAGATLEAIAEHAGFSKGVVYSQFANKPDLFLTLLEQRIDERAEANIALATGSGFEGLVQLILANAQRSANRQDWARLLIEFRIVAARDAELNARYAHLHARSRAGLADAIRTVLARGGLRAHPSAAALADVFFAMDSGVTLERALDPAAVPDAMAEYVARGFVFDNGVPTQGADHVQPAD